MELELSRFEQAGEMTIGELRVNGDWLCWTLEDRVRAARNHANTAIPAGTYEVRLTRSERLRDVVPQIVGVPTEFASVRLHGGVYSNPNADMSSSILLGMDKADSGISNHRKAYNGLMNRLESARGTNVSIHVTQPDNWPKWGEHVVMQVPRETSAPVQRFSLDDLQTVEWRPEYIEPMTPDEPAILTTKEDDRAWRIIIITWILAIWVGGIGYLRDDYRLLYLCSFVALFITALWFIRSMTIGRKLK